MRISYIRVSTEEQRPDRQIDILKGISDKLYIEKLSAVSKKRPVYEKVIKNLEEGDTLVVLDLDRVWRSTIDALSEVEKFRDKGVELEIINLAVDTSTPAGKFFFTVIAALATFERDMLSQRTKEGLKAARRRGKKLGRPKKLTKAQILYAYQQVSVRKTTITKLAQEYGCSRDTLSASMKKLEIKRV